MQYDQLGATGAFVSRIALGTMTFGGAGTPPWNVIGGLDEKAADEIVGIALDGGVNLVDTADMYAGGECEEILGRVLGPRRRDVVLATKLFVRMGKGPNQVGLSRLWVTQALEDSLRRLRTDHIDLYQIHSFDPLTPVEETLGALDDAVRQGKIRYIGASNLAAWQMAKYLGASDLGGLSRFVSQQVYYSLAGRDIEREILPLAVDRKLATLVYSPLAGGFLTGKFDRDGSSDEQSRRAQANNPPVDPDRAYDIVDALRAVAERHGVGVPRVAIAWVLAQPGVTSAIVGARRPGQLTETLAAADLELTAEDLRELDEAGALPPSYPGYVQSAPSNRLPLQG
ncbi:aldo/keto reductase [Streptomyces sp. NBC_01476]|uniref:aldo/keto reductase n=1 Tax=Streptomyces sp. NBC_01476 TaxID=2903881 RepID=UPI002E319FED|nr:aldo/keto reductase [Streptomyces sp. NBC_01476]